MHVISLLCSCCYCISCVGFDLDSVLYELQRVNFPEHKWRQLASSLRVGSAADNIDYNYRNSTGKLQAVVRHWMDNTTLHNQWITLVEAVIMCDERRRAKQLAKAVGVEYAPPTPPPSPPSPPPPLPSPNSGTSYK